MKGTSTIKCMNILTEFSQNTNVDLGKGTVLSKQEIIITFLQQFLNLV